MQNKIITFYSHGACREVTGSKHFLKIDNDIIQIDCGMFQGRREESYRKNLDLHFSPAEVGAILLTHGHFDHSGALPIMIKNGFKGCIHATSASRDITNIILLDSAYIQQKDYEYLGRKAAKHPEKELTLRDPFYNSQEALETMGYFETKEYHREFYPAPGVKARFFDAGHILGSAMAYVNIADETTIGFSGDLGRQNLPILKDPEIMPDLDYLVLESTYGNRLHKTYGMAKEELAEVVKRAYGRGGKIIIPAFTIERTQELIYILHLLAIEKKIPDIPIFIDSPMAVNATAIFKIHPECFDKETYDNFVSADLDPFGFNQVRYVSSVHESKKINAYVGPAIIISASGMAEVGRILHHLANNIENPANIIAIVGFMAEHTLGRRLVEGFKEVKIFGERYRVEAEIKTLNAFSAHADYNEIKAWVGKYDLNRLKKIFLVHGEPDALLYLQKELLTIGVKEVEIVEYDKVYELMV